MSILVDGVSQPGREESINVRKWKPDMPSWTPNWNVIFNKANCSEASVLCVI
jgi:hypothetical protein